MSHQHQPERRGRYFMIRSRLNDFVLEVHGDTHGDGEVAEVRTWQAIHDPSRADHQLWYAHQYTGTLRSKTRDLCLDIREDNVVIATKYTRGRKKQTWYLQGPTIVNKITEQVVDIKNSNILPGATLEVFTYLELPNQQWDFIFQPPRFFMLKNTANGKVLDVKNASSDDGAKVITWHDKGSVADNQVWWEDQNGVIRSKLNDFGLEPADDLSVRLTEYSTQKKRQQWFFVDSVIRNLYEPLEALEVKRTDPRDGSKVIVGQYARKPSQQWRIMYL